MPAPINLVVVWSAVLRRILRLYVMEQMEHITVRVHEVYNASVMPVLG